MPKKHARLGFYRGSFFALYHRAYENKGSNRTGSKEGQRRKGDRGGPNTAAYEQTKRPRHQTRRCSGENTSVGDAALVKQKHGQAASFNPLQAAHKQSYVHLQTTLQQPVDKKRTAYTPEYQNAQGSKPSNFLKEPFQNPAVVSESRRQPAGSRGAVTGGVCALATSSRSGGSSTLGTASLHTMCAPCKKAASNRLESAKTSLWSNET